MSPNVSIVILNWNGLRYLKDCLTSLQAQTYTDFEVILVDNGSTDGSAEWVAKHFPQVRLIRNEVNLGFAAANNQAICASTAPYVATLNNDTRVEPDWLAALVAAAERNPNIGMCASKMLFADRPDVINSAGICLDAVGIAWDRCGGELDEGRETKSGDDSHRATSAVPGVSSAAGDGGLRGGCHHQIEGVDVFGPCAGAALYRRAMLDRIGLFDEDFFAYLEDVDLAWRARLAGWRCLYVPAARVYHMHSATSIEGSPFKSRLLGRNKVWLIVKNYPMPRLLLYLPLIVLYDLAAVLFALVVRRDVHAWRGRWEGLKGLPGVWRKRRAVQALRRGQFWHRYLSPLALPWRVPARYAHLNRAASLNQKS